MIYFKQIFIITNFKNEVVKLHEPNTVTKLKL